MNAGHPRCCRIAWCEENNPHLGSEKQCGQWRRHRSELFFPIKMNWNFKQMGQWGVGGQSEFWRSALCTREAHRRTQFIIKLYGSHFLSFYEYSQSRPILHVPYRVCWHPPPLPHKPCLVTKHLVSIILQSTLRTSQQSIRKCELLCQWCSPDMSVPKS